MKAKFIGPGSRCVTNGKVYDVQAYGGYYHITDDEGDSSGYPREEFEVIPDGASEEPAATTNVVIDGPGDYINRDGECVHIVGKADENSLVEYPDHVWVDDCGEVYKPDGRWLDVKGDHRYDIVRKDVLSVDWDPAKAPAPHGAEPAIRTFETGATRNLDNSKNDYEGFLSPFVIKSFGDYMTSHRKQKDGTLRDSDNWQKGIPIDVYMKSMFRHFLDVWTIHRGGTAISPDTGEPVDLIEALNAVLFNVQGMMHETLKKESQK